MAYFFLFQFLFFSGYFRVFLHFRTIKVMLSDVEEATSPQPGFPNSWSSLSSFPLREKFNRKRKKKKQLF